MGLFSQHYQTIGQIPASLPRRKQSTRIHLRLARPSPVIMKLKFSLRRIK